MKSRRSFIGLLLPGVALSAQKFGSSNTPQCPICHTPVDPSVPAVSPIVNDLIIGMSVMSNVRELFCQNCGNVFVAGV